MCGIGGFLGVSPIARSAVEEMLARLKVRGPDAQRSVLWSADFSPAGDHVFNALGTARLAIQDPRPEADQPMANDARDIWISYNGEVYDWAASRDELMARGVRFNTHCDTEFILRAYEAWGIECIERLRGMFAIAIVDLRKREAWLVRDRLGLKPVVYANVDGALAFASTVRAVLPLLPRERRALSPRGIDAYLAHRYVPAPGTIFEHVQRLEAGHWLRFDLATRTLEKRRYWSPHAGSARPTAAMIDHAIDIRLVSDRPLGVFLSSGVDSTTLASRLGAMGHRVPTYTASFPGSSMDESAEAAATAAKLAMPNHAVPVPTSISGDFARIVADMDEPFADPSALPTWILCREATRHIKVSLGGEGLDELLGGYKRVAKHARTHWRRSLAAAWLPLGASPSPKGWAKWSAEMKMSWLEAYSLRFSGFTPPQRRYLQPALDGMPLTHWRMPATHAAHPMAALVEVDFENYLPEYILRKTDLASMSQGLELRAPFLDHHFVEAVAGLSPEERFTEPPKLLLERLIPELKPLDLFGRKKRGFNPPLRDWLARDLAGRFEGLGSRLADATSRQVDAAAVDRFCASYLHAGDQPGEQLLQLLILDESLAQLRALAV
jgi:asparagine synthase (glutamine-hydrolysing)